MEQMMSYIFNGLQRCDDNFVMIEKAFKAQNKLNRLMSITLLVSTYASYAAYKSQRAKISALTTEIEKLKRQQEPVESAE